MLTLSKLKIHIAVFVAALTIALVSPALRAQRSARCSGATLKDTSTRS